MGGQWGCGGDIGMVGDGVVSEDVMVWSVRV